MGRGEVQLEIEWICFIDAYMDLDGRKGNITKCRSTKMYGLYSLDPSSVLKTLDLR